MPRLSTEARQRVVCLLARRYSVKNILQQENVDVIIRTIYNLVKKFQGRGSVFDLPRRKRAYILMEEMKRFIEEEFKKNN